MIKRSKKDSSDFRWSDECGMCGELVDDNNWNEIEEDCAIYCNNSDWDISGGTCWEQRVCEDVPEMLAWLYYGFDCAGCIPDEETGECCCVNEDFLDP